MPTENNEETEAGKCSDPSGSADEVTVERYRIPRSLERTLMPSSLSSPKNRRFMAAGFLRFAVPAIVIPVVVFLIVGNIPIRLAPPAPDSRSERRPLGEQQEIPRATDTVAPALPSQPANPPQGRPTVPSGASGSAPTLEERQGTPPQHIETAEAIPALPSQLQVKPEVSQSGPTVPNAARATASDSQPERRQKILPRSAESAAPALKSQLQANPEARESAPKGTPPQLTGQPASPSQLQANLEAPRAAGTKTQPSAEKGPPLRHLDPDEIADLMRRGEAFIATGDLASARLVLQRAAEAGDPKAALALAGTHDPVVLETLGIRGFLPDITVARSWYERAKEFGSAEAARRLEMLASRAR